MLVERQDAPYVSQSLLRGRQRLFVVILLTVQRAKPNRVGSEHMLHLKALHRNYYFLFLIRGHY